MKQGDCPIMMCIASAVNYCDTSFMMMCKLFRDYSVSLHIPHVVLQLCGIVLKKRSFDASREVFQGQSLAALHSAIYVETSFALCIFNIMQEHKTFAAYWNFKGLWMQKDDSIWEESQAHTILTTYVRPLLIWAAITMICRFLITSLAMS